MKKYILLTLATISFVACTNKVEDKGLTETQDATTTNLALSKVEIAPENIAEIEFKIEGMTCQMGCANTIKTKLEALDGVDHATVNFDEANAIVSYDKTVLTVEQIKNTVNSIADGKLYKVIE